jgi:hypothetical protein
MFNKQHFFPKFVPFMTYVEKYYRAGQATDYEMAHAYFTLIPKD